MRSFALRFLIIPALAAVGMAAVPVTEPVAAERVPLPAPAKAFKGEQCVEPNDVMRRRHMSYLKHQRDDTLREGIRGQKYSLRECIECHAVPEKEGSEERSVAAFCGTCHAYAAVTIDCFQCHTDKAEKPSPQGSWITERETLIGALRSHLGEGRPAP